MSAIAFLDFLLLNVFFVCLGRYGVNRVTNQLQLKCVIRYPVFLICDRDQIERSVSRLSKRIGAT
ncbi:MAG: hypothetical protein KME18_24555 [Phormidium tanganyikae FI6-MK23]|nr:hypothetical protein [Phormidium tanganyikae FI6-MK23]